MTIPAIAVSPPVGPSTSSGIDAPTLVLGPVAGAEAVSRLVSGAAAGGDLASALTASPDVIALAAERGATPRAFVADLLDPANYTGLAGALVDDAVALPGRSGDAPRTLLSDQEENP